MSVAVRRAGEPDRREVALCIAQGFREDFSVLCRDEERVAAAIAPGLSLPRFFVGELAGEVAGVLAISDCTGRAARVEPKALRKHLGLLPGLLGTLVLREEFEKPLDYPPATGYLEFVAVKDRFRRQGVATRLLRESMAQSGHTDFVLDVTDRNAGAMACYTRLGFKEFRRVPEKHPRQKGFAAKIYLRYPGKEPA